MSLSRQKGVGSCTDEDVVFIREQGQLIHYNRWTAFTQYLTRDNGAVSIQPPGRAPRSMWTQGLRAWYQLLCSCSVTPTLRNPMHYSLPGSSVHRASYILLYQILSFLRRGTHMFYTLLATAKSFQSCPTLCDPIDSSPPGSPVPGILQTRTLEWVAISFSNA